MRRTKKWSSLGIFMKYHFKLFLPWSSSSSRDKLTKFAPPGTRIWAGMVLLWFTTCYLFVVELFVWCPSFLWNYFSCSLIIPEFSSHSSHIFRRPGRQCCTNRPARYWDPTPGNPRRGHISLRSITLPLNTEGFVWEKFLTLSPCNQKALDIVQLAIDFFFTSI